MLPAPPPLIAEHSRRNAALIREKMEAAGGALSFAEYMELALYAPGLGYYNNSLRKFGEEGDFITAPELSPLFAWCLARQCADVLKLPGGGDILEFGAGSGRLAADLLRALEELDCPPEHYYIIELSADLRRRQEALIKHDAPHSAARVIWLERLPAQPLRGLILANEVMDAMPVHMFRVGEEDALEEFYVQTDNEEHFSWTMRPASERLSNAVKALANDLMEPLAPGYISEINLALPAWIRSVADSLEAGLVLLIDYGFPRREFYHPQRVQGTLMCHYRHYSHSDPLIFPGIQDITTHVDFTAAAEAAHAAGLHIAGYTTQGDFLMHTGIQEILAASEPEDTRRHLEIVRQVNKLIMPQEMGELFKLIALSKGIATPLRGFARDRRGTL